MNNLTESQERRDAVKADLEAELYRQQLSELKGAETVRESWQEVPVGDRFERSDFGVGQRDIRRGYNTAWDRSEGRFVPVYETEWDLPRIRAKSRNLSSYITTCFAALKTLQIYNIGSGFSYQVQADDGFREDVQEWLDEFLDDNCFSPDTANAGGSQNSSLENEFDRR
jgi:hypothetical protein